MATDGDRLFSCKPDPGIVVQLDRSGEPRTDEPAGCTAPAGIRTGQLGPLRQACGFRGRNTITVTVSKNSDLTLDSAIDREEPADRSSFTREPTTSSIDPASRQLAGDGQATGDGQSAVVRCDCEINAENRLGEELIVDDIPKFSVAFTDGQSTPETSDR